MKHIIIFSLIWLMFGSVIDAQSKIVLEGTYQGKNLYVQNPFTSSGVGFCTVEVTINGEKTTDEIQSSSYEIDFENFNLELGSKVVVEVKHKDGCKPKVINPEVIRPRSTFITLKIEVTKENELTWTTKNEMGKMPYIIEQFMWNKWVKVGEVQGKGNVNSNSYSYKITPHFGVNKFRVKQVDASGDPRYSEETTFRPRGVMEAKIEKKNKKEIVFSRKTMYEIYDTYGNIKKKGADKTVNTEGLPKGNYILLYDNKMDEYKK